MSPALDQPQEATSPAFDRAGVLLLIESSFMFSATSKRPIANARTYNLTRCLERMETRGNLITGTCDQIPEIVFLNRAAPPVQILGFWE